MLTNIVNNQTCSCGEKMITTLSVAQFNNVAITEVPMKECPTCGIKQDTALMLWLDECVTSLSLRGIHTFNEILCMSNVPEYNDEFLQENASM